MEQPYIVSARKYRPSTFRSVVGQKALTTTLKNAIDSKRLAQAYLFCGPRGVGKTSCARIFAKTINCLNKGADGEACNECESCRAFNEGGSFNIVELDAASNNSVDDIRNLTDQVHVPPQIGDYRVFIIDEVHMLSVQAFNAFLKTLEEPPKYVVFILATTEKHKVIPTILSRCQIYDFNRITVNDMVEHLSYVAEQEGITAENSALGVIARKADGAMRDALSIFDQVAASSMGNITYKSAIDNLNVLDYEYYFRLVDTLLAADAAGALLIYKEVRDAGFDSHFFVNGLGGHLRDLMVAADERTLPLLEVGDDVAARYREQASKISPRWFHAAMEYVNFCDLNYRQATSKQFLVELTLMRIAALNLPSGPAPDPSKPQVDNSLRQGHQQPQNIATAPSQSKKERVGETARQTAAVQTAASKPSPQRPNAPHAVVPPRPTGRQMNVAPTTVRISSQSKPAANSETLKEKEQPSEKGDEANPALSEDRGFTPHDLLGAWSAYQTAHPDQKILVNAMRTCLPEPTADPAVYRLVLENPAQQAVFEQELPGLYRELRKAVGNNGLRFDISVAPPDAQPKHKSKAEYLREIVGRNPVLGDILNGFDCRLES